MPGTAKRKCEPSSSVASLASEVHEQKPADSALQPLGGTCIIAFSCLFLLFVDLFCQQPFEWHFFAE